MSAAVNRSVRTATKQLRIQPRAIRLTSAPLVARSASASLSAVRSSIPASYSAFSTSTARHSGPTPNMAAQREYDPEIKDIADYVANKTIDSELAVSNPHVFFFPQESEISVPREECQSFCILPRLMILGWTRQTVKDFNLVIP